MHKNNKLPLIICALLFSLALFYMIPYSPEGHDETTVSREDTVIFDLDRTIKTPGNFNWFTPGVKRLQGAHQSMWEPLFILDYATGELIPWLALSINSNPTHDIWTLTLRQGVEWSDGEAFNADDVVFTSEMVIASNDVSASEALNFKSQVKAVEKLSDFQVQFVLKAPSPSFHLDNFAVLKVSSFLIMPEHIWRNKDVGSYDFYPPIGTGPYTFHSATSQRAIWDRNDNWWGAKTGFKSLPEPKRLIWVESGGQENRAQMLNQNMLDAGQHLALGIFEAIQQRNPNVFTWHDGFPYSWTDPCPRQLEFNTTIAPWDQPLMRRAISYIIDRQQIVDIVYEGSTIPSRTMFVEYGAMKPFINKVVDAGYGISNTADIKRGQALIESMGYSRDTEGFYSKDGVRLAAPIVANTASSESTNTVDLIVEQLQHAGIDARSVPVEDGIFWGETIPLGNFEIAYSWLSCGSVSEPWASMNRYTNKYMAAVGKRAPGFNNTGRWNTAATQAYTDLVNQVGAMSLGDSRIPGLVTDAYQHLNDEMPFIPLVQAAKVLTFNQHYWQGWPSADDFYTHPMHWWNSAHLIIHNLEKNSKNKGTQ